MEIIAERKLTLDYRSPSTTRQTNKWTFTIYCKSKTLNSNGMVIDFDVIKKIIHGKLNNQYIYEIIPHNPTAENIAKWCCDEIPSAWKCEVQELKGNTATYIVDDF